ncbi:MAG: hypothetical protein DHS20C17_23850 [Cyclobacteriaceae bacterium]|nr:MAG: hypothetical protein DHS20C17_23850 [Cyclobacteriaceae bacterium]
MELSLKDVREVGNIELLARQMVEGFITGLHKSPYHGFSVEFAEHQLYNSGESTRHIDWKVFAKTDRLYTKRYEEETNLRCHLVLDCSSSMYYPKETKDKITFSIMAAAALTYLLQKQRDAVGLFAFTGQIDLQTPVRSTSSHAHKIFLILERLLKQESSQQPTEIATVLHEIAQKIHKRSLVVLFSDMFHNQDQHEEVFTALQHLKHHKNEVLIFHITDHQTELNFEFDDRPYEFIDLESGAKTRLVPGEIKSSYQQAMKNYYQQLKMKCNQFKIDLVEVDVQQPFQKVLSQYLIKRARMK